MGSNPAQAWIFSSGLVFTTVWEAVRLRTDRSNFGGLQNSLKFSLRWLVYFIGKNRIYLARGVITPKFSDDMQGRSMKKKVVRVNFKLFAESSITWRIWSNDTKLTCCIISRFFYRITLFQNTTQTAHFKFELACCCSKKLSQKYNGIWSSYHYPCLVLGLVFQKQENNI